MWSTWEPAAIAARECSIKGVFMREMFFVLFGACCFFEDIKRRSISLRLFVPFIAVGAGFFISGLSGELHAGGAQASEALISAALSFPLPAVLFLISLITREAIGLGDCLFFFAAALYLSPEENLELFLLSLGAASVGGLFISARALCRGERAAKRRMPFLAFVFPVYLILLSGRIAG